MRHRFLRHPTFRFALLFALFFSVVALGQYLFARQKAYREVRQELLTDATHPAESIGVDWSKIGEYRRTTIDPTHPSGGVTLSGQGFDSEQGVGHGFRPEDGQEQAEKERSKFVRSR